MYYINILSIYNVFKNLFLAENKPGGLRVLKLQELTDDVPKGEMPRHMQLYCDRYCTETFLCDYIYIYIYIYIIIFFSDQRLNRN